MAPQDFKAFGKAVRRAVNLQDGARLASLMDASHAPAWASTVPISSWAPTACESFEDVAAAQAACAAHLAAGHAIEAYNALLPSVRQTCDPQRPGLIRILSFAPLLTPSASFPLAILFANPSPQVSAFTTLFRKEDDAWCVAPLHALVGNVRNAADAADRALIASGRKPERLENAGNQLMACFAAANRPGANPDKRKATLRIVNALFRIYFKLNTLRNCKYLIRVVEAKNFLPLSSFATGDVVTYRFFVGRLAVFDEDFVAADRDLSFAFRAW